MPHQCLKCGNMIKSGSSDILKGCSKCGGKKFFFITQPVSDVERLKILDKVEHERENLLSRANEKFEKLIQEAQERQHDGERLSEHDLKEMIRDSWVKVDGDKTGTKADTTELGPNKEFADRPQGLLRPDIKMTPERPVAEPKAIETPIPKVAEPEVGPSKEPGPVKPSKKKEAGPKAKGLTKGKKAGGKKKDIAGKKEGKAPPKAGIKAKPEVPLQKYKETVKSAKEKKKTLMKSGRDYPAVINVKERGVYEIDVKALLEDSPIIVQSDGTYLLHLQSIFEKAQKKADLRKKRKNA